MSGLLRGALGLPGLRVLQRHAKASDPGITRVEGLSFLCGVMGFLGYATALASLRVVGERASLRVTKDFSRCAPKVCWARLKLDACVCPSGVLCHRRAGLATDRKSLPS
jgi:hypothetical protein